MSSFVPAQFSSFTSGFDFDKLRTDTTSSFQSRVKSLKKPQDFFDHRRISKPNNFFEVQQRVLFNLSYFSSNYLLIVGFISLYCILTNLPLLFLISFDVLSFYAIQKVFQNSDEINLKFFVLQKNSIYTTIILINLPILLFASPITTLIWLTSLSAIIVLCHAAFLEKPIEAAYAEVA
ncbi:hypothetical protein CANARDRAFT_133206 [[Candida] arabinofermentans NRRL YB-2248]|uniref:PRA1 family protein n=1 Tax=[Candida] arabinofermentans NRRL YB-2248 TaxID=983967 RepID=A0A1E4T3K1_9ASCO|nr:hypothetical protein CANARDRAFT_133206 [[Candida] arabinofermentans NRRL YB-2248]